jgi:hypothetical protein
MAHFYAGTGLGPVHDLSVRDYAGLCALRGGPPVVQRHRNTDKAITLTLGYLTRRG